MAALRRGWSRKASDIRKKAVAAFRLLLPQSPFFLDPLSVSGVTFRPLRNDYFFSPAAGVHALQREQVQARRQVVFRSYHKLVARTPE